MPTSPNSKRSRHSAVLGLLPLLIAGCQSLPGAAPVVLDRSAPRITLKRGVNDSTLAMKPPYFSGRDFSLTLRKKTLFGWVSPAAAGGGALRVHVEDDEASGFGPHGPVGMDIVSDELTTTADGFWDGQRVHLSFEAAGLHGTVADLRAPRATRTPSLANRDSCQYTLDRLSPADLDAGVFEGFSICAGMPQRTRLEVPPAASTLLSRSELVTVLVAMLSTPPLTQAESRVADGFDAFER